MRRWWHERVRRHVVDTEIFWIDEVHEDGVVVLSRRCSCGRVWDRIMGADMAGGTL